MVELRYPWMDLTVSGRLPRFTRRGRSLIRSAPQGSRQESTCNVQRLKLLCASYRSLRCSPLKKQKHNRGYPAPSALHLKSISFMIFKQVSKLKEQVHIF